jgi:hypothetical protein
VREWLEKVTVVVAALIKEAVSPSHQHPQNYADGSAYAKP